MALSKADAALKADTLR